MESEKVCIICQDFEAYVGHETDNCPKNPCQNCGDIGHIKINCVSWKKSLRLSIENEYPPSKRQKLSNSCFEDLPDEVILRVLLISSVVVMFQRESEPSAKTNHCG